MLYSEPNDTLYHVGKPWIGQLTVVRLKFAKTKNINRLRVLALMQWV